MPRLAVDAGLRQDWDELVRRASFGPRISAAFAPFGNSNTKLVGGYSIIYDATNLALYSKPLDQQAVTVPFTPAGVAEAPLVTTFVPGHGPLSTFGRERQDNPYVADRVLAGPR
jgi:hypothetical protein